ncbi:hypothetical protein LEP1GSC021_3537 [Leptospira noguchii str. 1993005606]|uniref:Uncharacterized protein n=1 Tax=Leptospira noguchii str. 2007001578 TaxID=1049974 RepID=A0ABN0IXQ8_9LEPT|nr:hypothetical protein LEP1GSC035_4332 [Leptospira noguchii str. 2007001578]EPE84745.1 hypothetical protein LEP1GSC021_3537 [Leptospira noguchii str. 1993005606]
MGTTAIVSNLLRKNELMERNAKRLLLTLENECPKNSLSKWRFVLILESF